MKVIVVVFSIACSFLIISCDNSKTDQTSAVKNESQTELKISAKAIEGFKYDDYALSNEGQDLVNGWEKYQELSIQINYLKKADLSFFNSDKKLLTDFISDLNENVPERLQTNSITSRVLIVETKLLKLNENLTISNITTETKLSSIKEVLVAFSNLIFQINWKLEFDVYNKIEAE
ncbi:hypothetical protein [Winogradskyella sp. UBA3174]|uniref:hypothetical protein n=1 Tax=Winogradskyella sp. UBA3174 TaxID=1947785 RepID=UPI0025E4AE92|nr:hypothetical protein [Winogradskyella sp. UBA3174]|tara:strand:+ start:1292 stop:1819 length:528 start_codon:yes stop_codon:yes gene_type:complete